MPKDDLTEVSSGRTIGSDERADFEDEDLAYNRILVPIDFSDHSRSTVSYAMRFASRYGGAASGLRCRTGTQKLRTQQQETPYFATRRSVPRIKMTVPGINTRCDMSLIFSSLRMVRAFPTGLNTF